ncbi:hypothetical protein BBW65_05080 [Helicobacter enhydrae]|uniref:Uncharacterized protein n=1 Tax=Helicobacter enhydrae TaxID=222136 RepID=A0A1B1U634_9HELI|nr:hypothetical protein BBW65_05080 [Helicobacter enhydrae]
MPRNKPPCPPYREKAKLDLVIRKCAFEKAISSKISSNLKNQESVLHSSQDSTTQQSPKSIEPLKPISKTESSQASRHWHTTFGNKFLQTPL